VKLKTQRVVVTVIAVSVLLVGITPYSATTEILAFESRTEVSSPASHSYGAYNPFKSADVLTWHYHPGYVFNGVKSGT
jgi:hypothetical protein